MGCHEVAVVGRAGHEPLVARLGNVAQPSRSQHVTVPLELRRDLRDDTFARLAPRGAVHPGEIQADNGVQAAVTPESLARLRNGEVLEQASPVSHIALDGGLEEALQHADPQRLAEAPRPAEKRGAAPAYEIADDEGLVHIDEVLDDALEVFDADGQLAPAGVVNDVRQPWGRDRPVAHAAPSPRRPMVPTIIPYFQQGRRAFACDGPVGLDVGGRSARLAWVFWDG